MAHVQVQSDDIDLESPILVEGLPGAGLVGKIAADHLVEEFDMEYYAAVRCAGLPSVAVYHGNTSTVQPPVRIYADADHDLLVLQSDIPVSPTEASDFASCVTDWLVRNDVFPLYLSGLAEEKGSKPEVYGIATGDAEPVIDEAGIVPPREGGLVTGPTGALLHQASDVALDAVGLIVQTDANFPDPEAARALLAHGIQPIAGFDVDTNALIEHADDIQAAREQLAQQLQDADQDESTQAQPIRGFQ